MAGCYHGEGTGAVGANKTLLTLIATAATRAHLYDLIVGCEAAPADQATDFLLGRFTAVGTEGSGFTPVALDPADVAAICDCGQGVFGVEPTYTANAYVLRFSMNQRATFRWVAAPGGRITAPATANNGLGLKSSSATGAATHEAMMHWQE